MLSSNQCLFSEASEQIRSSFYRALTKIKIKKVVEYKPYRKLIASSYDSTLEEVMQLMRTNNILSIPIYKTIEKGREYLGVVSVFDILTKCVFEKAFDHLKACDTLQEFQQILKDEETFLDIPVGDVLGSTDESKESWTLHSNEHVSTLLSFLTGAKYHRIICIDDDQVIEGEAIPDEAITMITQTDLATFLFESRYDFGLPKSDVDALFFDFITADKLWKLHSTLSDPNQPTTEKKHVFKVKDNVTSLQAFKTMYMHRVSALAVVNNENKLVANISASDLRGITRDNLEFLCFDDVYQFLESTEKFRMLGSVRADEIKSVLGCVKMGDCLSKMIDSKVHRIWICDKEDVPTGVLTFGDILKVFVVHVEV